MNTTENCDMHQSNECDCIGQCKYNSNTITEDTVDNKAKALVEKFMKLVDRSMTPRLINEYNTVYGKGSKRTFRDIMDFCKLYKAKECTIICVDEILLSIQDTSSFEDETWEFWQQVLEKIKSI